MSIVPAIRIDPSSALPLASQISEQLRWLIEAGALSEGDELPPAVDLAQEVGVNFHTIRAAYQRLSELSLVSMGRGRRTTVQAVDRQHHRWTESSVPTYSIGVLIPEFVEHYSRLIVGIESEAAQQPTLVYIANAHESSSRARTYLDRFLARGVDGIIIAAALLDPDSDLPTGGPPIVFIDSPGARGPSIEFDLEESQQVATRHLIEHGHEHIGYVTAPLHLANVAPKLAGHKRALSEAGMSYDPTFTAQADDFKPRSGAAAALELLEGASPPTAITTSSDGLAFGLYAAARQLGMSIPDDVAVTSNDNTQTAELVHPGLTTTTLPLEEAGRLAVNQLQALRAGNQTSDTITLGIDLVLRESCGAHEPRS